MVVEQEVVASAAQTTQAKGQKTQIRRGGCLVIEEHSASTLMGESCHVVLAEMLEAAWQIQPRSQRWVCAAWVAARVVAMGEVLRARGRARFALPILNSTARPGLWVVQMEAGVEEQMAQLAWLAVVWQAG